MQMQHWVKVALPPLMGVFSYLLFKGQLDEPQARALLLSIIIVGWWIFESFPLAVTALLLPCFAVLLSLQDAKAAFGSFAHPLIFLFLGGFMIARAMSNTGLDRRVALKILCLPGIKGKAGASLAAIFIVAAFFSMWISNTATTAMMLPIGAGIFASVFGSDQKSKSIAFITMAYAASIGGMATPIGSPPNNLARAVLNERAPELSIDFVEWILLSLPLCVFLLAFLIYRVLAFTKMQKESFDPRKFEEAARDLGPMKKNEKITLASILTAAVLWVLPSLLSTLSGWIEPLQPLAIEMKRAFPDAVSAVVAASLLFVIPTQKTSGLGVLTWKEASQIDWASLLLFGGGLSLGNMIFSSGLGEVIGSSFVEAMGGASVLVFLFAIVCFSIFFTECSSNTATASLLLPLILSATQIGDFPPRASMLAIAWACSLAFMLPVATPPNAIVYGSGQVELKDMMRWGLVMNIVSIVSISLYVWALSQLGWL